MKKKSKKGQGPKVKSRSPSIPPEERVPDELVLEHPDISPSDVLNNADDTMALQVGNKPTMEELINHAKSGDKKSFLALVKMHTSVHPFNDKVDCQLIIPTLFAERDFYEQEWVQLKLKDWMADGQFEKDFWKAVFSRQHGTLFLRSTLDQFKLKTYVVNRRDVWLEANTPLRDIEAELIKHGLIDEGRYEDVESLRKILNRYGFKRNPV